MEKSTLTQNLMARKKKVLIVDDEPAVLSLLRTVLKQGKFEVVEARAADDALNLLEHESVDLVISDIRMPGMSGIELLDELREWDMDLPVIFISGKGTDREWAQAVQSSASALIEKPFKKEALLKAVQKAFHHNGSRPALAEEVLEDF